MRLAEGQRLEDLLVGEIVLEQRRDVDQVAAVGETADQVAAADQPADRELAELAARKTEGGLRRGGRRCDLGLLGDKGLLLEAKAQRCGRGSKGRLPQELAACLSF